MSYGGHAGKTISKMFDAGEMTPVKAREEPMNAEVT